jgi:hypothetical protein
LRASIDHDTTALCHGLVRVLHNICQSEDFDKSVTKR